MRQKSTSADILHSCSTSRNEMNVCELFKSSLRLVATRHFWVRLILHCKSNQRYCRHAMQCNKRLQKIVCGNSVSKRKTTSTSITLTFCWELFPMVKSKKFPIFCVNEYRFPSQFVGVTFLGNFDPRIPKSLF